MNTLHTNFTDEDQLNKILFRQLFLFQIQLEQFRDRQVDCCLEVEEMIQAIDDLMETILNNYLKRSE